MVGERAGDQWNEGDVSDSVVPRVAPRTPSSPPTGSSETFLTVLDEFGALPRGEIQRELTRYLPFLATARPRWPRCARRRGREGRARGDQGGGGRHRTRHAPRPGRQRRLRPAGRGPAAGADRRPARVARRRSDHVHRGQWLARSRPSYAGSRRSPPGTPTPAAYERRSRFRCDRRRPWHRRQGADRWARPLDVTGSNAQQSSQVSRYDPSAPAPARCARCRCRGRRRRAHTATLAPGRTPAQAPSVIRY